MTYYSAAQDADQAVRLAQLAEDGAAEGKVAFAIANLASSIGHLSAAVAAISRGLHQAS